MYQQEEDQCGFKIIIYLVKGKWFRNVFLVVSDTFFNNDVCVKLLIILNNKTKSFHFCRCYNSLQLQQMTVQLGNSMQVTNKFQSCFFVHHQLKVVCCSMLTLEYIGKTFSSRLRVSINCSNENVLNINMLINKLT